MVKKRVFCYRCSTWYRGKYLSLCNKCYKEKLRDGDLCELCKHPDCSAPVLKPGRSNIIWDQVPLYDDSGEAE